MTLNTFYNLARADFLQRSRNSGFFMMIVLTVYLSYLFVPPTDASYTAIIISGHRLFYNSTGIGVMFGMTVSLFLSLFAFYLVKNSIQLDRHTRVGQVIATTPTRTITYLLGKWASNLLLLTALVLVMTLMSPLMQWLRGEAAIIQLIELVAPIWLLGLPVMSLIAGLAVLFETIPFLRGGFGNIFYFFVWSFSMIGFGSIVMDQGSQFPDPYGLSLAFSQVGNYMTMPAGQLPDLTIIGDAAMAGTAVITMSGAQWGITAVLWRFVWLFVGGLLAVMGAIPFDRFNPAHAPKAKQGRIARWWQQQVDKRATAVSQQTTPPTQLTPLTDKRSAFRFGAVLLAEIKLLLKGQPWWWFAGAIGIIIYGAVTPFAQSEPVLIYAFIWPILIWSALGMRQQKYGTTALVWTTSRSLWRQLPAAWLAGASVSLLIAGGFVLQLLITGQWLLLLGVLTGALFVPALAMALGTISGTSRLFEVVYLIWWYVFINAGSGLAWLHFIPTDTPQTIPLYLGGAIFLLAMAMLARAYRH